MFQTLRTAALSAVIGLTGLTGMAATAQADGLYLNFGGDRDPRIGVYVGDGGYRHGRWQRRHRQPDRWSRDCTPQRAVDKARRLGLRHARVVDVDRRSIDVAGSRRGYRVFMTFARAPYCPVIR